MKRSMVAALAAAGLLLTGCASGVSMAIVPSGSSIAPDGAVAPSPSATSAPAPPPPPPAADAVSFEVQGKGPLKDGKALAPGSRLKVNALPIGSLIELNVMSSTGVGIAADTALATTPVWKSQSLPPSKDFQLSVQAPDGSERVVLFSTRGAGDRATATITPSGGEYGVGMPVVIEFAAPVKSREQVESRLRVSTSRDIGEASWFWPDSDTVMFRPKDFWPARTTVRVTADLSDVQLYPGVWGSNESAQFRIGRQVIMKENLATYTLKYYKDDKKPLTFPISGGMPGWETLNGIKIVHESYTMKRMINNAPGANYDVEVPYAMRLTYSGEFMHAAPWNGNIGYANTSHGCTNMTYDDAVWMYNNTLFGDVFITKGGAGGSMSFGDGLGGVWDVPWNTWVKGSALHGNDAVDESTA